MTFDDFLLATVVTVFCLFSLVGLVAWLYPDDQDDQP